MWHKDKGKEKEEGEELCEREDARVTMGKVGGIVPSSLLRVVWRDGPFKMFTLLGLERVPTRVDAVEEGTREEDSSASATLRVVVNDAPVTVSSVRERFKEPIA